MLQGYKTYIVSALSILASVALLMGGYIDVGVFTSIVSTALVGAGIRNSIK